MAQIAKVRNYTVEIDSKGQYTVKKKFFSMTDCGWHTKTVDHYTTLRDALIDIANMVKE